MSGKFSQNDDFYSWEIRIDPHSIGAWRSRGRLKITRQLYWCWIQIDKKIKIFDVGDLCPRLWRPPFHQFSARLLWYLSLSVGIIATQDEQNEQGAAGVQGVVKRDLTIFPAPPGTNFTARFAEPHIL